jgi:hypothetical protein
MASRGFEDSLADLPGLADEPPDPPVKWEFDDALTLIKSTKEELQHERQAVLDMLEAGGSMEDEEG